MPRCLDSDAPSWQNGCMTKNCIAKATFKMTTDAPSDEQFIMLAFALSFNRWGYGLDSLDLGDAMGVFIRAAAEDFAFNNTMTPHYAGPNFTVHMELDFDLYDWS